MAFARKERRVGIDFERLDELMSRDET